MKSVLYFIFWFIVTSVAFRMNLKMPGVKPRMKDSSLCSSHDVRILAHPAGNESVHITSFIPKVKYFKGLFSISKQSAGVEDPS